MWLARVRVLKYAVHRGLQARACKAESSALPDIKFALSIRGRPQFKNLLFHRGNPPCFFAFDLLTCDRKDLRTERLLDRKQELRRLLARSPADVPLKYTEYIDGHGMGLFQRVCELDLEGVVAKQKFGNYVTEREHTKPAHGERRERKTA